jgi:hypothetical protein
MVATYFEVEACLLSGNGIADKVPWPALLSHQGVAKARQLASSSVCDANSPMHKP